jgi:hypothetical protein
LAASDILHVPPVRWEAGTSLGSSHKTSLYSIVAGIASIAAAAIKNYQNQEALHSCYFPFAWNQLGRAHVSRLSFLVHLCPGNP